MAEANPLEVLFPKYSPFEDVNGRRPVVVAGRVALPVERMEFALTPPFTPVVVFAKGAPEVYGRCPVPTAVPEKMFVGLAKPDGIPVPVTEFALTPPFEPAVVFANGTPDVYGKCPVPAAVP